MNSSSSLSRLFIDQLYDIRSLSLRSDKIHQAKRCLLDYLGATYAGSHLLQHKIDKIIQHDCYGDPSVHAIGISRNLSLHNAVFINGLSSHVAEMDDGVRFGMIHPGSPVFSALLPAAKKYNVQAHDLFYGIIVGYESAVRIAAAMQPSHYKRGYHPTATCGTIASALALSFMLKANKLVALNALSASSITASGTLNVIGPGSDLKPFNVAQASLSGLMSYFMAASDFSGVADSFSGPNGFFSMSCDHFDVNQILKASNDDLWIDKVYVKPYASCRHAHPTIEAVLQLRSDPLLNLNNISSVNIVTYAGLKGRHDSTAVSSVDEAKMSIPFSAALAFVRGAAGIEDYNNETINNPDILNLTSKISIAEDDVLTSQVPDKREAIVNISTYDGRISTFSVAYPKGEPENPISDQELVDKFHQLAGFGGIKLKKRLQIVDSVFNASNDLSHLFSIL